MSARRPQAGSEPLSLACGVCSAEREVSTPPGPVVTASRSGEAETMVKTTSRSARSAGRSTSVAPPLRQRFGLGPGSVEDGYVVPRVQQPGGELEAHAAGTDPADTGAVLGDIRHF